MIVSINQPAFIPWLGYFHRIMKSDLHVVLDHVQFEKNSYTNRNRIKTPNGPHWLTIPLITSGKFGDLAIDKIEIFNDGKWQKKISETIKQFYKRAPYFNTYFNDLESIINQEYKLLNDLLKRTNFFFFEILGITTPLKYSSEMQVEGVKNELVLNICLATGCTHYISGPLGKDYLAEEDFTKKNIRVLYHDFFHPVYKQLYGEFLPNLSVIDLIFNEGNNSGNILTQISLQHA